MKRRLITCIVALTVPLTTVVGAPAQAAPATRGSAHPNVDVITIIQAAKAAYDAYKSFASGGGSLNTAVSRILTAIQQAQDSIINHIDAIAATDARACAQDAIVDFPNFDRLTPDNQQAFAVAATKCSNLIDSLLGTVADKHAKDQLGYSANAVGPIALVTRSRSGLSNQSFVPVLRDTNQQISTSLAPSCSFVFDPDFQGKVWACASYDGGFDEELDRTRAQTFAAANTSWPMANQTLAQLAGL
ncbi:hypothetical protein AMES_3711 [Amycolatopsis mediterranei S699]|uniref:Secreted protein n=2 Tax=Amycolatopsis mediterranei TaxID=33910 RepID=A0A0H3D3I3_AMYMU|nr:hypothetical protein [Amycolatopsis mediterranei]ADJ45535.1 hypothetical protein AMED_3756 [Amycolatopsis mediterranei U32]AEK42311.1 hypothetical protein RAM_19125 [Amycolatopsis mediterranei S699]AFO77247.1 hypothetical protein AMES_3711 [Amycolatopsis mediterranei S699]AGT84375.1 hypothetical protein B737_3711 [Amycolatopsis mediterranei RB]KDO05793.1 hypothetical protein DV26_36135 [Amycolatopsis mediterranei]